MMRLARTDYSQTELDWIKAQCKRPRADIHAAFVARFNRTDVSVDHIQGLCTRRGWSRGLPPKRRNLFSDSEINFIMARHTQARKVIHQAFCERFGRSDISVKDITQLCVRLGLKRVNKPHRAAIPYSDVELAWIEANRTLTRRALHREFIKKFDREDVSVDDLKSLCTRKGWASGRDGRFAKGSVPPNKGLKGHYAPGCEKSWFKKGHVPANHKPFGHERICPKDGVTLIKVDMDHPYFPGRRGYYIPKQRFLWEQGNGPIPSGMILRCLDGNKQNFDLDNWAVITKGLNARLNQRGYDDVPLELKPSAFLAAQLVDKVGSTLRARKSEARS